MATSVMHGWRILERDEKILASDEYDACADPWRENAQWAPAPPRMIGQRASDPHFPAHTLWRRREEQ